jgi:pilus assembly protein Flp/PilA
MWLFRRLARRARDEEGQGLAEYALILGLIAVVAISSLLFLGNDIKDLVFNTIGDALSNVLS